MTTWTAEATDYSTGTSIGGSIRKARRPGCFFQYWPRSSRKVIRHSRVARCSVVVPSQSVSHVTKWPGSYLHWFQPESSPKSGSCRKVCKLGLRVGAGSPL